MAKLKIDLQSGIFEVEGEESFVREIYQKHEETLLKKLQDTNILKPDVNFKDKGELGMENNGTKNINRAKTKSNITKHKESYSIIDLAFSDTHNKEDLAKFYSNKSPSSATEKNTVFVYYMSKILNMEDINLNHINTCYKLVNEKTPNAFYQSIADTGKKGWLNTRSMSNITLTNIGENLVEYDLPRKIKK